MESSRNIDLLKKRGLTELLLRRQNVHSVASRGEV